MSTEHNPHTLWVGGLGRAITLDQLNAAFKPFNFTSSRIITLNGKPDVSRGFGYVEFANEDDMKKAQEKLDNTPIDDRTMHLSPAPAKGVRVAVPGKRIYVGNLPATIVEDDLGHLFSTYGDLEVLIQAPRSPEFPHFAFLTFENIEDATKALEVDTKQFDTTITVAYALPRRERRPRVRAPRAEKAEATPAAPAFRAYIGKTEGLTKTEISESFAEFGKIKSVTLRTVKKIDAHYGFVSFEDEEALTAATKLGTRTIGDVEVVVEVAKTTPRRRTAKKAAKPAGEKSDDKPAPKERKAPTPPKNAIFVGGTRELTKEDVNDAFAPYGEIKKVVVNRGFHSVFFEDADVDDIIKKMDAMTIKESKVSVQALKTTRRSAPRRRRVESEE